MGILPRSNRREISDAYAGFIQSKTWDSFYTITCRKPRRDNIAFIRDISNVILEGNSYGQQSTSFIAIEPHQTGFIHAHGLIKFNDDRPKKQYSGFTNYASLLEGDCRRIFGFSRFRNVNSPDAVSNYCAKYVTKNNLDYEYDFLGDW